MNRLLKRQLKRSFGKKIDIKSLSPEVRKLLSKVESSYEHFEDEIRFWEHIVEVNNNELAQARETIEKQNRYLHSEATKSRIILEQYKRAIDESLLVSKTDLAGIITYVNDNFCKTSGYSREELIGKPHSIIRHPDMPSSLFKQMWETIKAGKNWRGEIKNLRKDKTPYYVDATIIPLFNSEGKIEEYLAFRSDITDRVVAKEQLDKELKYNEMLFEKQDNIVITISKDKGVLRANSKFFNVFGYKDLEDFKKVHNCICELFLEADGFFTSNSDFWVESILKEPDRKRKVLMRDIDKKERIYTVGVAKVGFDNMAIATFTDITELEEARKKAEASERAKAQFMANMSHEIRTPMNGIVGFTQLLLKSELSNKQKNYVSLIEKSTKTLLNIVNNILDFSKIESGNLELDFTKVNPFIDLKDTIDIFRPLAIQKGISLQIFIDSALYECLSMDILRITQILTNLIGNAIKFTPEGGVVSVHIKLKKDMPDSQQLIFEISDTGIGIPSQKLEHIFEPFAQADSSTTRGFGGTGLGLSISKSLCELMGGKIYVDSEEGRGSKFSLEVEFKKCEPDFTLSKGIRKLPIFVLKSKALYCIDVLQLLQNFSVPFVIIESLEDKRIEDDQIVIVCDSENLKNTQKSIKFILIDDSEESYKLVKNDKEIIHIDNFEEFPSSIYNAILSLNLISSPQKSGDKIKLEEAKILVAEDYEINRILIEEMLEEYGLKPEFAYNGLDALNKASSKEYDLILMDINMPKLNGLDATMKLRDRGITTPIVALTANALEGDRERFLASGMDDYLSKPLAYEELDRVLMKYLMEKEKDITPQEQIKELDSLIDENIDQVENDEIKESDEEDNIETFVESLLITKKKYNFKTKVIKSLFNKFLISGRKNLDDMNRAFKEGDMDSLAQKAHGLRGTALSLNYDEIVEICNTIEYGQDEDYTTLLKRLSQIIEFLETNSDEIIRRYIEKDGGVDV